MRRRTLGVGAGLAVVAMVGGGVLAGTGGASPDPRPPRESRATAVVTRGDLVDSTTASGSLRYADPRRIATEHTGTLTALPETGSLIKEGQALFEVDRKPMVRLDGSVPAWRDLGAGVSDGVDVEQLEAALRDLGYPKGYDLAVDEEWTWATTAAVKQWQEDRGVEETGRLQLGSVVFTPGDVRVTAHAAGLGSRVQPGSEVLEVSDRRRQVSVTLDSNQRHLAAVGEHVDLAFPDGTTVRGRIIRVEAEPAEDETKEETLRVLVRPAGKAAARQVAGHLDGSSVQVRFRQVLARGVLTVPASALVALSEGGYAVEVKRGSDTDLVPVRTGAFGEARVAVEGDLREGDKVVVSP